MMRVEDAAEEREIETRGGQKEKGRKRERVTETETEMVIRMAKKGRRKKGGLDHSKILSIQNKINNNIIMSKFNELDFF